VDEQAFATKYSHDRARTLVCHKIWKEQNTVGRRKRFTLMPLITLMALSLMVALPTLSNMRLYAASAPRYTVVTVTPGDTLWSIAVAHAGDNDVQETVDRITEANHLQATTLQPGQHLRIPE
jgi:nucleoid-associated protein YgaU